MGSLCSCFKKNENIPSDLHYDSIFVKQSENESYFAADIDMPNFPQIDDSNAIFYSDTLTDQDIGANILTLNHNEKEEEGLKESDTTKKLD